MADIDHEANARKARTDSLAAQYLDIDQKKLAKDAKTITDALPDNVRLFITGGAGSGKSTVSSELGELLDVPVFDFDEYIPGGYSKDPKVYRKRLLDGMDSLWGSLPVKKSWIVEHVESCNDEMVKAFRPTHCLIICPPATRAMRTAAARSLVSGESPAAQYRREQRAMESAEYARMQFDAVPGKIVLRGKGWELKEVKMC
jgi:hypothetical protein